MGKIERCDCRTVFNFPRSKHAIKKKKKQASERLEESSNLHYRRLRALIHKEVLQINKTNISLRKIAVFVASSPVPKQCLTRTQYVLMKQQFSEGLVKIQLMNTIIWF